MSVDSSVIEFTRWYSSKNVSCSKKSLFILFLFLSNTLKKETFSFRKRKQWKRVNQNDAVKKIPMHQRRHSRPTCCGWMRQEKASRKTTQEYQLQNYPRRLALCGKLWKISQYVALTPDWPQIHATCSFNKRFNWPPLPTSQAARRLPQLTLAAVHGVNIREEFVNLCSTTLKRLCCCFLDFSSEIIIMHCN